MFVAPGNQMTTFYRTGELDNCRQSWGDLVRCCRAKMMEPSDAKVNWNCISQWTRFNIDRCIYKGVN